MKHKRHHISRKKTQAALRKLVTYMRYCRSRGLVPNRHAKSFVDACAAIGENPL